MAKREYQHVGSHRVDIYRPKPKPKKSFDWDAFFGGMVLLFILLVVLGSCAG